MLHISSDQKHMHYGLKCSLMKMAEVQFIIFSYTYALLNLFSHANWSPMHSTQLHTANTHGELPLQKPILAPMLWSTVMPIRTKHSILVHLSQGVCLVWDSPAFGWKWRCHEEFPLGTRQLPLIFMPSSYGALWVTTFSYSLPVGQRWKPVLLENCKDTISS
jgi:hypothetical protein